MTSILKKLLGRNNQSQKESIPADEDDSITSDAPYMFSTAYYILVVLLIGFPMWFYTCSTTRYPLPSLTTIEEKLHLSDGSPPKLHLDVSVIQLSRFDGSESEVVEDEDKSYDQLASYLRAHLPVHLKTSVENISYNIHWRVRRPTIEEAKVLQAHQRQSIPFGDKRDSAPAIMNLEKELLKVHRNSGKFRLFIYLIEEPHYSTYCDPSKIHTYTIGFERFVYLCPSNAMTTAQNYESTVNLINQVLEEIYVNTVDQDMVNRIRGARMDLLFSLIPLMSSSFDTRELSSIADKILRIYDKNVVTKFPELKELVNFRAITQSLIDVLDDDLIGKIAKRKPIEKKRSGSNETLTNREEFRIIQLDKIGLLFNKFEARVSKHSTQNVHNILCIVPSAENDTTLVLNKQQQVTTTQQPQNLVLLEDRDSSSLLLLDSDKTLTLGLRAVIRRVIGLASGNLCKNCLVRRDIFFNHWELDAIMGALTITKLHRTLTTLKTLSVENSGVRIPKDVSLRVKEARDLALESIRSLETKNSHKAYQLSSQAYELAEWAFYDPELLESLYFPDDVKYAIYSPLFLPLSISFLISFCRLLKYVIETLKKRSNSPKIKSD